MDDIVAMLVSWEIVVLEEVLESSTENRFLGWSVALNIFLIDTALGTRLLRRR